MNKTFKLITTNNQLHILIITYKFRVVSIPLIREYRKVKNVSILRTINKLCL
jgi:hypothetical protein